MKTNQYKEMLINSILEGCTLADIKEQLGYSPKWKLLHNIGFENVMVSDDGQVVNWVTGNTLKQNEDKGGYKIVSLANKGKKKTSTVNRLMLLAHNYREDHHLFDSDHLNSKINNLFNLRWLPISENRKDKTRKHK